MSGSWLARLGITTIMLGHGTLRGDLMAIGSRSPLLRFFLQRVFVRLHISMAGRLVTSVGAPGRVQDPEEDLAFDGGRRRRVLSRYKVGPNWDTMRFNERCKDAENLVILVHGFLSCSGRWVSL